MRDDVPAPADNLPDEDEAPLAARQSITFQERRSHSGPLPDPVDFGAYETVLPGAAHRILTMAEAEQSHRHTIDWHRERAAVNLSYLGALSGHVVAIGGLVLAGVSAFLGYPILGGVIGVPTIASMVYAFLQGRRIREADATQMLAEPDDAE